MWTGSSHIHLISLLPGASIDDKENFFLHKFEQLIGNCVEDGARLNYDDAEWTLDERANHMFFVRDQSDLSRHRWKYCYIIFYLFCSFFPFHLYLEISDDIFWNIFAIRLLHIYAFNIALHSGAADAFSIDVGGCDQ